MREKIIELRRYFHQHPEPSLKEYKTSAKIREELEKMGVTYERVGETGVVATLQGGQGEGKTLLLRADIDALELEDKTGKSYESQHPGLNHACGHDGHTASLLGAIHMLKNCENQFKGTIKFAFQQAEEIGAGARLFVQQGVLKDVDEVFGIHLDSDIPVGKVAVSSGPSHASCDIFNITVHGKSSHAAQPHLGRDALLAASSIVVELQKIVGREVDPLDSVVVAVGVLRAGTRYNIVANHAEIEGTVRAFSQETRAQVLDAVKRIVQDVAAAHRTEVEIDIYDAAAPLINNKKSATFAATVAQQMVGVENVITEPNKKLGADDFADFLAEAPGVYCRVGTRNLDNPETHYPHHHEKFDIDEESLLIAANFYVQYALCYLNT